MQNTTAVSATQTHIKLRILREWPSRKGHRAQFGQLSLAIEPEATVKIFERVRTPLLMMFLKVAVSSVAFVSDQLEAFYCSLLSLKQIFEKLGSDLCRACAYLKKEGLCSSLYTSGKSAYKRSSQHSKKYTLWSAQLSALSGISKVGVIYKILLKREVNKT